MRTLILCVLWFSVISACLINSYVLQMTPMVWTGRYGLSHFGMIMLLSLILMGVSILLAIVGLELLLQK